MNNVLITGSTGQLGYELQRSVPDDLAIKAVSRPEFDLANVDSIRRVFEGFQPNVVVNAAAYTAVDKAESDRDSAFKVNSEGVSVLAGLCAEHSSRLIHVSTDFVFDGSASSPYQESETTSPLGVYGETKLAGEQAVLKSGVDAAIIRTAWVYSAHGGNFVKTMLRLMAEKAELGVVADQIGTPTWAKGLAHACWQFVLNTEQGVFHYSDDGHCSWYEFASEIQRVGLEQGLLEKEIPIRGITTQDYPTPAARPAYSVLDKSKIKQCGVVVNEWQSQLALMLRELKV